MTTDDNARFLRRERAFLAVSEGAALTSLPIAVEQLADRVVPVDAGDGVGEEWGDRDHGELAAARALGVGQGDGVGDDDLAERRL